MLSEEEKNAIRNLTNKVELWNKKRPEYANSDIVYTIDDENKQIQTLLNLINKKTKEIKELKEINKNQFLNYEAKIDKMEYEMGYEYISKDKVLKAMGYEENDEEYKRIYNKEELILSLIRTINEECERLEDIEDQKTMLEIHNIENQRDKYWQDKIRDYYNKICASVNHFESKNDNNIVLRIKRYLEELLEEN